MKTISVAWCGRSPAHSILLSENERTLLARGVGVREAAQALYLASINPILSVWQGWGHNRVFHRAFSTPPLDILWLRRKQVSTEGVTELAVGQLGSRPLCKPTSARQGRGKSTAPNEILLHFYKSNSRPPKCTIRVTHRRLRHSKDTSQIPPGIFTPMGAGSGRHSSGPTSATRSKRTEVVP